MNKKKVVLVEDDEDDRLLFADFLEEREDFVLAESFENGIELLRHLDSLIDPAGFPDLIVLDQNMPKMSGFQTLEALKKGRYNAIPVALYTTYADKNLVAECYEAGAADVIVKPISPSGYHEMMDEFNRVISAR